MKTKTFSESDWNYFCSRINWRDSYLDAKAIQIMNRPLGDYISAKDLLKEIEPLLGPLEISSKCKDSKCTACKLVAKNTLAVLAKFL